MADDIQTVQIDYAYALEMLWRQSQTIKRLQQENEKLRAKLWAATGELCDRAAAAALKGTGDE